MKIVIELQRDNGLAPIAVVIGIDEAVLALRDAEVSARYLDPAWVAISQMVKNQKISAPVKATH